MSRQVARNAFWNLAGALAAVAVGLIALPVLLHALGSDRLGVFTLALGLIGFTGLLDLGLGRALTQGVSSALGRNRSRDSVAALVWYILRLLVAFGVAWSVVLWILAPLVTRGLFNLQGELMVETIAGLRWVALSMPFSLVATGAMGALEGLQRFRQVSTQRTVLNALQFGLPTLVALWRPDVGLVIGGLAASRVLGMFLWLNTLRRALPKPRDLSHSPDDLRHLLRFGGWLSVSNLIGPLMVYADRFYLATLFSPATVAIYTVPYDALSRMTYIPNTAIGAMFPALAEAQTQPVSTAPLLRTATAALVALMLPPMLLAMVFVKPLLSLWLGKVFALSTLSVFRILMLGVFANSVAQVPYALLQAHGRSDVTAKLHLIELPPFVCLLIWAVSSYGVTGAALSWTLRVILDASLLYGAALLLQHEHRKVLMEAIGLLILATCALLVPLFITSSLVLAPLIFVAFAICFVLLLRFYRQWHSVAR
jgi:O-antigen/teichoic acid export membrane protein